MKTVIWRDNEEKGPFSRETVSAMLASGEISMLDLARYPSGYDWKPLRELLGSGAEENGPQQMDVPAAKPPVGVPAAKQRVVFVPSHAIAEIRQRSAYRGLRSVLGVVSTLAKGMLSIVLLLLLLKSADSRNSEQLGATLGYALLAGLSIVAVYASHQASLVLIDIADILMHQHGRVEIEEPPTD